TTHGAATSLRGLCASLGVAPATYYRARRRAERPTCALPRRAPPRTLAPVEQQRILDVLHEDRFIDLAPAQVYATLLDEGVYHCAERTMYRLLAAHDEIRERRAQRRHPVYTAPELLATASNQLWSWDITKLKGPTTWSWYHLYVILDVFSRYVVGWMVAPRESALLAERLIAASCAREHIGPNQLTLHADRGSSMVSQPVAHLLADLGVTKSHSRPSVSNDNPFSEAQFKTLKYRPDFPARFGSLEDARAHCVDFFHWYNTEHHHSGLGLHTPFDVHHQLADARNAARADVLTAAYAARPDRFVHGLPTPRALPTAAWINPPTPRPSDDVAQ
ncbi:IS3 family transposase, partial [Gemmatimonas sp.]|uniref:IS3 family transposase n=1 Tax=Gemmatimonas sp. TaxID=1962908 RepID=UPI00286DD307